ncbi:MAG: hypothetical protein PHG96_10100, partial [Kiritimatiellae bacterium]|nr:hypothetical protein [Kiritimatiellia bacterium]MDD4621947.1 hypothetical protein [Kiritimatiellia bacterium]
NTAVKGPIAEGTAGRARGRVGRRREFISPGRESHRLAALFLSSQRRIEVALRHIQIGRESQDNEQWHMLLWSDLCQQKGIRLSWFRHFLLPRKMTFVYFCLTRLIYRVNPIWSFAMNAAFESHAEHEYMLFAQEHPEFDQEPVESVWFSRYPRQTTLGDLVRRVGLDERDHMNRSLDEIRRLRGG